LNFGAGHLNVGLICMNLLPKIVKSYLFEGYGGRRFFTLLFFSLSLPPLVKTEINVILGSKLKLFQRIVQGISYDGLEPLEKKST